MVVCVKRKRTAAAVLGVVECAWSSEKTGDCVLPQQSLQQGLFLLFSRWFAGLSVSSLTSLGVFGGTGRLIAVTGGPTVGTTGFLLLATTGRSVIGMTVIFTFMNSRGVSGVCVVPMRFDGVDFGNAG